MPPSVAGDFIAPSNSSTTKKRESPSSNSACMIEVPSGAMFRSSSCAPSARVYQSIAPATPLTTSWGVIV